MAKRMKGRWRFCLGSTVFFLSAQTILRSMSFITTSNDGPLLSIMPVPSVDVHDGQHVNQDPLQHQSTASVLPPLRFDWENLDILSPLGKIMASHQADCSKPLADFRFRNRFGLGSDLHLWSQALCNAMEMNHRVVTHHPWIYWDQKACQGSTPNQSPSLSSALACYFGNIESTCPGDMRTTNRTKLYRGLGRISHQCPTISKQYSVQQIRTAAMEVLFHHVSPTVVHEARRQLQQVVLRNNNQVSVPANLITVHIRWGDKVKEMELVPMQDYVGAVQRLLSSSAASSPNANTNNATPPAHIFLATEDPQAVQEFMRLKPPHWEVYVDAYFSQFKHHRIPSYNGNPQMSKALHGTPGLSGLASLLVAMEANDFVLTTASNWSRLINELRQAVVEPRIDRPTRMIDLRPGEW